MPAVEDFPDLLPFRTREGEAAGLFSDLGAWFGLTWGTRTALEVRTIFNDRTLAFHLGAPLTRGTIYADRLEGELENGALVRVGFASSQIAVVEYRHTSPPDPDGDLSFAVRPGGDRRWFILLAPEGGEVAEPDVFAQNRLRWNALFQAAWTGHRFSGWDVADRVLARAVTTLYWNRKVPRGDLSFGGILPTPFGFRGFWSWDSWKHSHALAEIDPGLALEQLRALFSLQAEDGMVPDTAMARAAETNRRNAKPSLAVWALEAIWRRTRDAALLEEAREPVLRWLGWWDKARRRNGETLYRCGGMNRRTATWESGWDDSLRFRGIPLQGHDSWKLFDLWQPDLNSFLLVEHRALLRLAKEAGIPAPGIESGTGALEKEIRSRLWDEELGAFCDHRASTGESTGILCAASWAPAWAGAAGSRERESLRDLLLDPQRFATPFPFPSLAVSENGFQPEALWNGGGWFDHAAMALELLGDEGEPFLRRSLEAVDRAGALYECYNPSTGEPCGGARPAAAHFSGTAANLLEICRGGLKAAPG
ncbi:MAG: trehalase family glycosidase [Planctomycetota bacterium]